MAAASCKIPMRPSNSFKSPTQSRDGAVNSQIPSESPKTFAAHSNIRKLQIPIMPTLPSTPPSAANDILVDSPTTASTTTTTDGDDRSVRRSISIGAFPRPPRSNILYKKEPLGERSTNIKYVHQGDCDDPVSISAPRKRTSDPIIPHREQSIDHIINNHVKLTDERRTLSMPSSSSQSDDHHSRSTSTVDSVQTEATQLDEGDCEQNSSSKSRVGYKDGLRTASMSIKDGKGNVIVSVRVKPSTTAVNDWEVDNKHASIVHRNGDGGSYSYDNVFDGSDDNFRVYDNTTKRIVRRVMEGFHGTVFAYGHTGSGKTHSMQGTAECPGIIPMAIIDIFAFIREHPSREFLLRVSYLEIYNERIYDLLNSTGNNQGDEIKLRQDPKRGVYADPLREEIVQSPTQLLRVIARGDLTRRTSSTQFNARSSRSHAVVQIIVESRERVGSPVVGSNELPSGVLISTLSLIDLAGSEKAAEDKERRTEGSNINKSLLTLGTIVSRLSKTKPRSVDKAHLPYRDSKLTRLLQPALSGDALVSILCTIQLDPIISIGSALVANGLAETINTLNFASRAKNNIVSHAKRNETIPSGDDNARVLLDKYRTEIKHLRRQLETQNSPKVEVSQTGMDDTIWHSLRRESQDRHEEQLSEIRLARTALKDRISHLNKLILSSKSIGLDYNAYDATSPSEVRSPTYGDVELFTRPNTIRKSSSGSIVSRPSCGRIASIGSNYMGTLDENEDVTDLHRRDSHTSLHSQLNILQADSIDKNRYIASLERRLLEAHRQSPDYIRRSSATSTSPTPSQNMIRERDAEIASLKARLDDQTRMVNALLSAAKRRDHLSASTRSASSPTSTIGRSYVTSPTNEGTPSPSIRLSIPKRNIIVDDQQPRRSSDDYRNNPNIHRLPPLVTSPTAMSQSSPSLLHIQDDETTKQSRNSVEEMNDLLNTMIIRGDCDVTNNDVMSQSTITANQSIPIPAVVAATC